MRSEFKSELKATNQRIEQLERGRTTQTRAPSAPVAPVGVTPANKSIESQHGWLVHLEPWKEDGKSFAVNSFHGPANDFNLDLHTRYNTSQNRFVYHGVSLFRPKEPGEYTFRLTLMPVFAPSPNDNYTNTRFNCSGEMRINGNVILTGTTPYSGHFRRIDSPLWEQQDYYGQVFLAPAADGKGHQVEFSVDCYPDNFKKTTYYDIYLGIWKLNKFQVRVKGPGDMNPRPFAREELFFLSQR